MGMSGVARVDKWSRFTRLASALAKYSFRAAALTALGVLAFHPASRKILAPLPNSLLQQDSYVELLPFATVILIPAMWYFRRARVEVAASIIALTLVAGVGVSIWRFSINNTRLPYPLVRRTTYSVADVAKDDPRDRVRTTYYSYLRLRDYLVGKTIVNGLRPRGLSPHYLRVVSGAGFRRYHDYDSTVSDKEFGEILKEEHVVLPFSPTMKIYVFPSAKEEIWVYRHGDSFILR